MSSQTPENNFLPDPLEAWRFRWRKVWTEMKQALQEERNAFNAYWAKIEEEALQVEEEIMKRGEAGDWAAYLDLGCLEAAQQARKAQFSACTTGIEHAPRPACLLLTNE